MISNSDDREHTPGTIDYAAALNAEQLAAVLAPDGPVFVLAAAGTGKTRTLVYRVAHLVERGIDPQRILLLTFTNRAAREMMERAQSLVGQRVGGLWGGTFHHMANRILRRQAPRLQYGFDFTILDQEDSCILIKACVAELKLKSKEFPRPGVLYSVFSGAVNGREPVERALERRFGQDAGYSQNRRRDGEAEVEDLMRVYQLYERKKREQNAMDFDDLLINGLRLFKEHPEVCADYQDQFQHVLVDEYQDTNPIQAEWVDLIVARRRNVLVVGDDFQSIYSWRGADYRNIMTFPERYPDARHYKLVTNYRSTPEILDVANSCIAHNPRQFQKELYATRASTDRPLAAQLRDGGHQARFVAQQVRRLLRKGYAADEIAVLYRAHYQAMELQLELTSASVNYHVTSGIRFFEQSHVKDACSFLRLLHNPGDELAFLRLLQLFPRVGLRTAEKIWQKLGRRVDIKNAAANQALIAQLPALAHPAWTELGPVVQGYESEDLQSDPGEIVLQFIKRFYEQVLANTYDDYERRLEDLQEMIGFMSSFESNEAFLNEMALVTNLDAEPDPRSGGKNALRLSTVHQAKGLEWKAVIILWAADGMFPLQRCMDESPDLDEERRLFYVAVTRARDELIFCVPQWRRTPDGGVISLSPSRFLMEADQGLLQWEQIGFI